MAASNKARANAEAAKQVPYTCDCIGCNSMKREETVLITKDALSQGGALRDRRALSAELAAHGVPGAVENGGAPSLKTLLELAKVLVATGAYMLTKSDEKAVEGSVKEVRPGFML